MPASLPRFLVLLLAAFLLALAPCSPDAAEELDDQGRPLLRPPDDRAASVAGEAGAGAAPPAPRIGVVDLDRMTRESARIRGRIGAVEGRLETYSREVETRTAELERDRLELARKRSVLSAEELARRERRLRQLDEEIESIRFRARRLTARLETEVVEPSLREIVEITRAHAEEAGFDLVLRRDLVIFASPAVDLTPVILARLDALGPAPSIPLDEENSGEIGDPAPPAASPTPGTP